MHYHAWELIDDFDNDDTEVAEFLLNGRMVVATFAYLGTCIGNAMHLGLVGVYAFYILTFVMYYAGHSLSDRLMDRFDSSDDDLWQGVVILSVYVVLDIVLFSVFWGVLRAVTAT